VWCSLTDAGFEQGLSSYESIFLLLIMYKGIYVDLKGRKTDRGESS